MITSTDLVIDLSRLVAGFCPEVLETPEMRAQFLNVLFKASEWGGVPVPGANKTRDTNALLTLRVLANLLSHGSAAGATVDQVGSIFQGG